MFLQITLADVVYSYFFLHYFDLYFSKHFFNIGSTVFQYSFLHSNYQASEAKVLSCVPEIVALLFVIFISVYLFLRDKQTHTQTPSLKSHT